jgi:tRNA/tmRNA/rRNA uracil-C5-methylase (TrmA/RlmC/RlmD family)
VRKWLLSSRPGQLFYVSCDPTTLARDLGVLSARYTLEKIVPFDFFPQTSHVETLCQLLPREAP